MARFFERISASLVPAPASGAGPAEAAPPAPSEGAFPRYNRHRRLRLEAQVGERGAEALRLLPLLLHVNHEGLPGYVDDATCPAGLADYSPSNADLALARRLFPGARIRRTGILRPAVDLVAVMGSVGTIGFSGDSDLDVWVCHDRTVRGTGLRLYREKVRAVEAWLCRHANAEVHLFLQATERIRANDFGETDVEGCGSALGALLKEEFYRTAVVLAGKVPYWWHVPAGVEPEAYEEQIRRLGDTPASGTSVDLGCLVRVPLGELFGAAVWQIVKGWKSPFKSALKMGLLEKTVRSDGRILPLCETLKQRVLAGEHPDPYRLLFDEVLAHYRDDGDGATQDLLARCFYLKTGIRLDPDALEERPRREDEATLWEYVRSWGWGPRRVRHLNEMDRWKFEWVQALAKELDRFFLRTYKRIRAVLDESGETQRITPRDLTVLGRKLQVAYRRAPHKVETLHLVTRGVAEPSLSLYQETLPDGEAPWRLFRGRVTPINVEAREGDLLRESVDPLELLVWAAQNKLLGSRTRLFCRGVEREIPAADLENLGQMLASYAARSAREEPPLADLSEPERVRSLLVVANLGLGTEELREVGVVRTSSWGETFYRRWSGPEALRGFAEECLIPLLLDETRPEQLEIFTPPRKVGVLRGLHRRLQRELPALVDHLGGRDHPAELRRRHVGAAPQGFFVLDRAGDKGIRYRAFPEREGLLRYLSGVGPYQRVDTQVEHRPGDLDLLGAIHQAAAPGAIDVFVLREPELDTLFIVDEVGNLIHFPHAPAREPYALARLLLFLKGSVPEIAAQPESPLAGGTFPEALRIHTVVQAGACRVLDSTEEQLAAVRALRLHPTGLTIEKTGGDGTAAAVGYRITWGSQTIRSGEVENPLAELRRRILQARRSGSHYDIFVTRLFLDEGFVAEYAGPFVTTGHYLFYKKAIEQRLSA